MIDAYENEYGDILNLLKEHVGKENANEAEAIYRDYFEDEGEIRIYRLDPK